MASEAGYRATVKRHLSPFGKIYRVESPISDDIPDINYLVHFPILSQAVSGWLELKEEEPPKRATTPINIKSLQKGQVLWHREYALAGGRAFTLIRLGRYHVLVDPATLDLIYKRLLPLSGLREKALVFEPGKFPTAKILSALVGPCRASFSIDPGPSNWVRKKPNPRAS